MKKILTVAVLVHGLSVFAGSVIIKNAKSTTDALYAGTADPLSLEIRQTQIESLLQFYQKNPRPQFLAEAVILAENLYRLYPNNAQAWTILADTRVFAVVHGGITDPTQALYCAGEAIRRDPLSIQALETKMFLLTAMRKDQPEFKRLGIQRTALTKAPLKMVCPLCGKHWLAHRRPPVTPPSGWRATRRNSFIGLVRLTPVSTPGGIVPMPVSASGKE